MAGEQTSSKERCVAELKDHDKQTSHASAAVAMTTDPGLASEDDLEASMLEFSEQLENVTRSIREGWARTWSPRDLRSETPPPNGSPHGSAASSMACGDITGTMALMERLIEDIHMDQEELTCLLAQDDRTNMRAQRSKDTSEMSPIPMDYVDEVGGREVVGQHTQTACSDRRIDRPTSNHTQVPLAKMEDFSEENGFLTDATSVSNLQNSSDANDASETGMLMGSMNAIAMTPVNLNGDVCRNRHKVIDVNANGISMQRRRWTGPVICNYDDLESVLLGDSDDEDDNDGDDDDESVSSSSHCDMLEFAERYFNVPQVTTTSYSGPLSKTVNRVKKRASREMVIPIENLLSYTKQSVITSSLVRLLVPDDIPIACSIFKDICRYMKGELKGDTEHQVLQGIINHGLQRIDLRDEIFCQLIRQTSDNPHEDLCLRVWQIMCLCVVSFHPSRTLKKYLLLYLRQSCDNVGEMGDDSKVAKYASYCLWHLGMPMQKCRRWPPSLMEIQAVCSLQPLLCHIHFLDGSVKAIAIDPAETVASIMRRIQQMILLENIHGWALYESKPAQDRHIKGWEYIADILADWEECYRKYKSDQFMIVPKRGSLKHSSAMSYGRLVFCKHVFQPMADTWDDPVEYHLLYAQALHYVVQVDEFAVLKSAALQLAGLQAQIQYGDYDDDKVARYQDIDLFLCQRVLLSNKSHDWNQDIATAHKKFGRGKTEIEAKMKYLTIVSQYTLYGCTKIFAHYRGVWPYGIETVLAFSHTGISFVSMQERHVVCDMYYAEVENILLQERYNEYHVIIQLRNCVTQDKQKVYMFECLELDEVASAIEYHSPRLAYWVKSGRQWKSHKVKPPSNWIKLLDDILMCRRALIDNNIIQKTLPGELGLFRSAISKLSGRYCRFGHQDDDVDLDMQCSRWLFSKVPFKTSLMHFDSHELEDVSARMFNSTLVYTRLESSALLEDIDLVTVVQTLITKCMESSDLCNEFYLQLIKQTTDSHAEMPEKACIRYWHLMTMAVCVMLPSNQFIFTYLILHLKRYSVQRNTDIGKYAYFCIKSICRTYELRGRKYPPSQREINFVTNRHAIEARVHLANGHQMLVEFDSASTADELLQIVKAKTGMRLDSEGYGIFQICKNTENYLPQQEKLADCMYLWEKTTLKDSSLCKEIKFLFRKRIFIEPFANMQDPVEIDLLYHQSVTDLFEEKILLTKVDVLELCALRAQTEYGDYGHAHHSDYGSVMRILPRHIRELIQVPEIATVHKLCLGMSPIAANISCLYILSQWPLYGATFFEVTVSGRSLNAAETRLQGLPRSIWLAVSQMGIHLLERKGHNISVIYLYKEITDTDVTSKMLTFTVGHGSMAPSLVFHTAEATEIAGLMHDYKDALARLKESHSGTGEESVMAHLDSNQPTSCHRSRKTFKHHTTLAQVNSH